jgi:hypothetical protein
MEISWSEGKRALYRCSRYIILELYSLSCRLPRKDKKVAARYFMSGSAFHAWLSFPLYSMAFTMLPISSNMYSMCLNSADQLKVEPTGQVTSTCRFHQIRHNIQVNCTEKWNTDTVFQVKWKWNKLRFGSTWKRYQYMRTCVQGFYILI